MALRQAQGATLRLRAQRAPDGSGRQRLLTERNNDCDEHTHHARVRPDRAEGGRGAGCASSGGGPGEVVVNVERVGVCGTDVEFFTGEMAYLHQGYASGQEVGVRGGRAGALAEQLAVPATSLHVLPDSVDSVLGALVEPGGNSLRSAQAAALAPGDRALVLGPGTIGLLAAMFARAAGADLDRGQPPRPALRRGDRCLQRHTPACSGPRPGGAGRVVYIGLAGSQSHIDTRTLVLKDVTAVGILSGSPGLDATIAAYASGAVDPRPLVAATVSLEQVSAVLAGNGRSRPALGPKIHVDPLLG